MKTLGIFAAASLALAPALVGASQVDADAEQNRPAPGPVASAAQTFGDELDPDLVVVPAIGLSAALLLLLLNGGDGDGDDDTTTTTTTTTTN